MKITKINYKPINQFVGVITLLLLCFAYHAFGCGAPQTVSGRVIASNVTEQLLLSRAAIRLESEAENEPDRIASVSVFGYYFFDNVTPCSNYIVSAFVVENRNKGFSISFAPAFRAIYVVGDAPSENVDFEINVE
jgi:hypothetical protein